MIRLGKSFATELRTCVERAAFAHGAPFNGTAFYLVFSTDQDEQILRVFTNATSYTPDEAAWEKLSAAEGTIKLEIMSAIFENNLLTSDGGPYDGSSITLSCVAPIRARIASTSASVVVSSSEMLKVPSPKSRRFDVSFKRECEKRIVSKKRSWRTFPPALVIPSANARVRS